MTWVFLLNAIMWISFAQQARWLYCWILTLARATVWGAGLPQCWGCPPPTNVSQVRFPFLCHRRAEFVVCPRLASGVFRWVLHFSSIHKFQHLQIPIRPGSFPLSTNTNITKFQFHQDRGPAWKPAKADVASSLNTEIYTKTLSLKYIHSLAMQRQIRAMGSLTILWILVV